MASDSVPALDWDENHIEASDHATATTTNTSLPVESHDNQDGSAGDVERSASTSNSLRRTPDSPKNASPFQRLPSSVIERILYLAEPNDFASLALTSREWRRAGSSPQLYRHLLASCGVPLPPTERPSGARTESILELRRAFNREARRNVFDVFLRPRQTLVKLISSSTSSSSSFPQGEAFRFAFSAKGHMLLSLSSSRIFVLDLSLDPISVRHELKTLRRPVAATISDDGSVLAVASSEHQVNIYQLTSYNATLIQSISLTGVPRALEFSPQCSVLSVSYDSGIEVCSLGETALPTDRRAVRCPIVDNLTFSPDGSMLLGSTCSKKPPNLVTISPPFYTDMLSELSLTELRTRMWTTQILFPEVKPGYSHVTTVPSTGNGDGGAWVVGYDTNSKSYRMMQVDEPERGTTYFVGPGADRGRDEPGPKFTPAASGDGDLLALGFQNSEIWIYGLSTTPNQGERRRICPCQKHIESRSESSNLNRLKKMVEGEKTVVQGCLLASIKGVTAIKWANTLQLSSYPFSHRLVAVAPGGVNSMPSGLDGDFPVDGGRIMLFDFSCSPHDGKRNEVTIEVGEAEPTPLAEPGAATLDVEVELARRRTRINRRGGLASTARYSIPSRASRDLDSSRTHSPGPIHRRSSRSQPNSPTGTELAAALTFLDGPYSNTAPRSRDTLSRAATAAANNRGRSRYENTRFAQTPRRRSVRQVPHESDADNWVPPPPPYTPTPPGPLPAHLQKLLLPATTLESTPRSEQLRRSLSSPLDEMAQSSFVRPRPRPRPRRTDVQRVPTSPVAPAAQDLPEDVFFARNDNTARQPDPIPDSSIPSPLRAGVHGRTRPVGVPIGELGQITRRVDSDPEQHDAPVASSLRGPLQQPQFTEPPPAARATLSSNLPVSTTTAAHHTNNINTSQQASAPVLQEYYSPRLRNPTEPQPQPHPTTTTTTTRPRPPNAPFSSSRWGLNLNLNFNFSSNSLHPNPNPKSTNNTTNVGVERSRSRSQDVPRRRPYPQLGAANENDPFYPRAGPGRRVMSSQSDQGLQPSSFGRRRRLEECERERERERELERVDGWQQADGRRRKKDFGRCVVM